MKACSFLYEPDGAVPQFRRLRFEDVEGGSGWKTVDIGPAGV